MGNKVNPASVVSYAENPGEYELLAAFLMASGKYVSFKYYPLPECKRKLSPSAYDAREDTVFVEREKPEERNVVKGYIEPKAGGIRKTAKGYNIVTLRNMNRRRKTAGETGYYHFMSNKQADGSHKRGFKRGEYLYRTSRLDIRADEYGLDLSTLEVNFGRKFGMVKMFPNAKPKR